MSHFSPIRLGVNVDHIATLRNARGTRYPDPLHAALLVEQHGADSITMHLREDRRHIKDIDIERAATQLQTALNLEMAVTEEMLAIAERIKPRDCCLVPEKREELTTEGGLDVIGNSAKVSAACKRLNALGIQTSLFIDPEAEQLDAALQAGAPAVELHTGNYADATSSAEQARELSRLRAAAAYGTKLGLRVHAGHGLHYHNVQPVAAIEDITELNIGHALVAHAAFVGLPTATAEMKRLMTEARR